MNNNVIWCLFVTGSLLTRIAYGDPQVSISSASITAGDLTTVDVDITGLTPGTALGAFDFTIDFNSAVVSLFSGSIGDPVLGDQLDPEGLGYSFPVISSGSGSVEMQDFSIEDPAVLSSLQSSSFVLGTLTFEGISSGPSALSVSASVFGDQYGNAFSPSIQAGNIQVIAGSVTGAPELDARPAASAFTLLIGSFLVLRGGRRRRSGAERYWLCGRVCESYARESKHQP
jgi:hypothetical protein